MLLTFCIHAKLPGDVEVTVDEVRKFLGPYPHFVVREHGDKTKEHYQGYVDVPFTARTFQNRIIAQWPAAKSSTRGGIHFYSCAPVKDLEKYRAYCCKGYVVGQPVQLVSRHQIDMDDDQIEEYHKRWKPTKEASKVHIVKRAIDHFKSVVMAQDVYARRAQVLDFIMTELPESGHDEYRLTAWLNGVMNNIDATHRQQFISRIVNKHS